MCNEEDLHDRSEIQVTMPTTIFCLKTVGETRV